MKKDAAELQEEKKQLAPPAAEAKPEPDNGQVDENKEAAKAEDSAKHAEQVVHQKAAGAGGDGVKANEVLEKPVKNAGKDQDGSLVKKAEKYDLVKDSLPGKVAGVEAEGDKAAKAPDVAAQGECVRPQLFLLGLVDRHFSENAVLMLVLSPHPTVPLPEAEHHHPADGAPAADSKDTADDKLEGNMTRVHRGSSEL